MRNSESGDDLTPFAKGSLGEKISEGSHADVFELRKNEKSEANFVVKIGKTNEYKPPILKALNLSISRKRASQLLQKLFGPEYNINPNMNFIKNGVAEYALMKRYFSCRFEGEENKGDKNPRDELITDLRNENSPFYEEMRGIFGKDANIENVIGILEDHRDENFLPKEQIVVGHPPELTPEEATKLKNEGKELPYTYYLIQEMIKGEKVIPLTQVKDQELKNHPELVKKLLTFAMLTKKMYGDTGKLIDMRPDEVAKHPFEWFQKTSNILVDLKSDTVNFVDTRWLYDRNTRIIGQSGINLVDKLGRRSIDRAIKKYAGMLKS